MNWWQQFPANLQLVTRFRLFWSVGTGGVIYFTPLVFNKIGLTAAQIGSGIAAGALLGVVARIICGTLLDRGLLYKKPIRFSALIVIFSDIVFLGANNFIGFIFAQLLLGIATGFYWPSIEIAVSQSCTNLTPAKGYALTRSIDSLGIGIGALIGTLFTLSGQMRLVYLIDSVCMLSLLLSIKNSKVIMINEDNTSEEKKSGVNVITETNQRTVKWIKPLLPLLIITLVATSIFSLIQSLLPLDVVRGGLQRQAINESWSGALISLQLILLILIQWPIGKWLSEKSLRFGLSTSLISFTIGCLSISLSSLFKGGTIIIFASQIPIAYGIAAFLPTSTRAVVEITPKANHGKAMALFSQCFAISSVIAPVFGGYLIERQGNSLILWLSMAINSTLMLFFLKGIDPIKNNYLKEVQKIYG